jgi:hypothetical protein
MHGILDPSGRIGKPLSHSTGIDATRSDQRDS